MRVVTRDGGPRSLGAISVDEFFLLFFVDVEATEAPIKAAELVGTVGLFHQRWALDFVPDVSFSF